MRIDLIFTPGRVLPAASSIEGLLVEARRRVGSVCLSTNILGPADVEALSREGGIPIFQGNEITTNQGDVLVFGYPEDVKGVVALSDLRREVQKAGGLMIVAHPFRGFLLFGIAQLRLDVEQASRRAVFQNVDGVEVLNCKVTDPENDMARRVADRLGLLAVAGSDAIGWTKWDASPLERTVRSERELVEELRRTLPFKTERS
jgi:predicted metal-dependent phosphoesterase TrpH